MKRYSHCRKRGGYIRHKVDTAECGNHKARCKIAVVIALPMHVDKAFGVGILDVGTVAFVNRNAVTSCNKANYIVSGKRNTAS